MLNTFRFLAALVGHSVDPVALAAQLLDGGDVGVAEEQAFPLLPLPLLVGRGHVEGGAALRPNILFLKHASSIFRHSSNPVCGFSMVEPVRLFAL